MKMFLSKEQTFDLAKKYIKENDIDGFNKMFIVMTPQMLFLLNDQLSNEKKL